MELGVKKDALMDWLKRGVFLLALGFLASSTALAQQIDPLAPPGEADGWAPAFAIAMGVRVQGADANASSTLRSPAGGDDMTVEPYVGGSLQLMAPSWFDGLLGRPRLFVHGGLLPAFGFDRDIAKEGDPDGFRLPDANVFPEGAIEGVGTSTSLNPGHLMWTAGIGASFEFTFLERKAWIKPSFEYIHYDLEIEGTMLNATKPAVVDPNIRFVTIRASENLDVDAIGPGVEFELDAGMYRRMGFSVFAGVQAYKVLGDTEVRFGGSFTDGFGSESASFSLQIDPWLIRGGVGLRMRWLPQ
jgi:hypothetical protein